jgi:light-harvesting complex 1 beta chain
MTHTANQALRVLPKKDSKTFVGIFLASFVVFLAVALMAQILTWQWRSWLPGAEGEKTMIGGVKAAVYTVMSQIT